jgi:hypothetical protein
VKLTINEIPQACKVQCDSRIDEKQKNESAPRQAVMATRKRAKSTSKWCKIEAKPSINGGDMIKRTYGVTQLYHYRQDRVRAVPNG